MADTRTSEQRRKIMQAVKGKDTGPEYTVRRLLHSMGYRYRLHVRGLPGTPDIVFPNRRKVVFIHGCFWHGHGCRIGRLPKSRPEYWNPKVDANRSRDSRNQAELHLLGWDVSVVWQCEIKNLEAIGVKLRAFLGPSKNPIDTRR